MKEVVSCRYYEELEKNRRVGNEIVCNGGCSQYHNIIYLENSYKKNIKIEKETLLKFMEDEQSRVRYLSILIFLRYHRIEEIPRKLHYDPYHKIRIKFVGLLDTHTLLEYIDNENEEVKCAILEEIMRREFSIKEKPEVLKKISHLVTSRSKNIRILSSRCIRIFYNLDGIFLDKLFTKRVSKDEPLDELKRKEETSNKKEEDMSFDRNDITGMIVYGLEDDCYEVRLNTIVSLYSITNEDNINESIEFFVDTLNDENTEVREVASKLLNKLTHKYKFVIDYEYVKQVSYSLFENNKNIKDHIIDTISNVEFSDLRTITFVFGLIKKHLKDYEILRLLFKMYRNNSKLFLEYSKDYKPRGELKLTELQTFIDVAINFILNINGEKRKVNKNIKNSYKYILLNMSKEARGGNVNLKNMLREILKRCLVRYKKFSSKDKKKELIKDFLKGNGYEHLLKTDIKTILESRKSKYGFHLFFCYLFKYFFKYLEGKSSKIYEVNYKFTCIKDTGIVDRILGFLNDKSSDLSFIEDLLNDKVLNRIEYVSSSIRCPDRLDVKHLQPLVFTVDVSTRHRNCYLRIENEGRMKIDYPIKDKRINIEILENESDFILCYILIKEEDKEIILSKEKLIKIVRK